MYPLLKRDGLALPTLAMTLFWNFALGCNPFALVPSFVKYFTITCYCTISVVLFLDSLATPPTHLPDLFIVLNVILSCGIFGVGWLWSLSRLLEEAWGLVGLGNGAKDSTSMSALGLSTRRRRLSDEYGRLPSESEHSFQGSNGRNPNPSDVMHPDALDMTSDRSWSHEKERLLPIEGSRIYARRSRMSPLVSPDETVEEDLLSPPAYGQYIHSRSSSSSSFKNDKPELRSREHSFKKGTISTHVSPSKTDIAYKPRGRHTASYNNLDQEVVREADRWHQATLQEFQ